MPKASKTSSASRRRPSVYGERRRQYDEGEGGYVAVMEVGNEAMYKAAQLFVRAVIEEQQGRASEMATSDIASFVYDDISMNCDPSPTDERCTPFHGEMEAITRRIDAKVKRCGIETPTRAAKVLKATLMYDFVPKLLPRGAAIDPDDVDTLPTLPIHVIYLVFDQMTLSEIVRHHYEFLVETMPRYFMKRDRVDQVLMSCELDDHLRLWSAYKQMDDAGEEHRGRLLIEDADLSTVRALLVHGTFVAKDPLLTSLLLGCRVTCEGVLVDLDCCQRHEGTFAKVPSFVPEDITGLFATMLTICIEQYGGVKHVQTAKAWAMRNGFRGRLEHVLEHANFQSVVANFHRQEVFFAMKQLRSHEWDRSSYRRKFYKRMIKMHIEPTEPFCYNPAEGCYKTLDGGTTEVLLPQRRHRHLAELVYMATTATHRNRNYLFNLTYYLPIDSYGAWCNLGQHRGGNIDYY